MVDILGRLGIRRTGIAESLAEETPRPAGPRLPSSEELLHEEALPRLASVRTIHHTYSSAGLSPQRLGQLMRDAEDGDSTAWLEIAEQIEEKDGHVVGIFGQRKRAVTGLEITVEAASDDTRDQEIAEMVRDWIDRDELRSDLFDIMDALGKGYSVSEIIWNKSNPNRWTIERLEWRDQRWFEFDKIDGRTLKLKGDGGELLDLTPCKYIVHQVKAKSGLPIRSGVMRPVSWYWLYKNFSVRDWVIFAEAYGQPLRVGKYGPGASEKDRQVLLRAVTGLGSDAGAIIPDSMMIEFVKDANPTGSIDLYERLARYCDEQMSKAVLGQTTTADALGGGGLAGNEAHNEVRGDIADDDAASLAATLNRQLVRPMVELNYGKQKQYPRIRIRRPSPAEKYPDIAAMQAFVNMGGKVSIKRMATKLDLPLADENEEVLHPAEVAGAALMSSAQPCGHAGCKEHGKAAMASTRPRGDAIDKLADELAGEWEELLTPLQEAINEAIQTSRDFEELSDKLLALASREDGQELAATIEKALFAARLAGNLGADLEQ